MIGSLLVAEQKEYMGGSYMCRVHYFNVAYIYICGTDKLRVFTRQFCTPRFYSTLRTSLISVCGISDTA